MTGPLDGYSDHPLGGRGVPTATTGVDLAELARILLDEGQVLVVDFADLTADLRTAAAGGRVPCLDCWLLVGGTLWCRHGLKRDIVNVDFVAVAW